MKKLQAFARSASRNLRKVAIGGAALITSGVAFATDAAPLDLSGTASGAVTNGTTAGTAALPILGLLVTVGIMIKVFGKVGGRK